MKEKLYMGVDLGTSFIKTGVYSLDGRLHAGWSEPVKDERPAPGVFLQHGEELYRAVCSCIAHTTESLGQRAGCKKSSLQELCSAILYRHMSLG